MQRGRAYRRHHRQRICRKRFGIIYHCWRQNKHRNRDEVEALSRRKAKQNLSCNCGICSFHKHARLNKAARRRERMALRKEVGSL